MSNTAFEKNDLMNVWIVEAVLSVEPPTDIRNCSNIRGAS